MAVLALRPSKDTQKLLEAAVSIDLSIRPQTGVKVVARASDPKSDVLEGSGLRRRSRSNPLTAPVSPRVLIWVGLAVFAGAVMAFSAPSEFGADGSRRTSRRTRHSVVARVYLPLLYGLTKPAVTGSEVVSAYAAGRSTLAPRAGGRP